MMTTEETLRYIRQRFFAMRNGILSDAMRRNGDPHPYNMGCMLIDVMQLSKEFDKSIDLAEALWGDTKYRECRMMAPLLYPADRMTQAQALAWCSSVETTEIADILCHRLLRNLPFAIDLVNTLSKSRNDLEKYTAYRLLLNLLIIGKAQITPALEQQVKAEFASATQPLKSVLASILEED